jgi:hypothetical protein
MASHEDRLLQLIYRLSHGDPDHIIGRKNLGQPLGLSPKLDFVQNLKKGGGSLSYILTTKKGYRMLKLPTTIITLTQTFRSLFREPTWRKAQILLLGAILTTGKRTVTASLRVMGLSEATDFAKYHQVLNRAMWSPRQASEKL